MKKSKPKQQGGGLIPHTDEYPQTRKMTESFKENMAIYDFVKHLMDSGYVIARRHAPTGQLQIMEPWKTTEFEILRFRNIDRLAYQLEASKLRSMYPHLIEVYGVNTEYELPVPEVVEQVGLFGRATEQVRLDPLADRPDDEEMVSLSEAWRRDAFSYTPSHSGIRVKLARCRRFHPDLMPKMVPRGTNTLYKLRELRVWEYEYTKRCATNQAGVQFSGHGGTRFRDDEEVEAGHVEVKDALSFLRDKIKKTDE